MCVSSRPVSAFKCRAEKRGRCRAAEGEAGRFVAGLPVFLSELRTRPTPKPDTSSALALGYQIVAIR